MTVKQKQIFFLFLMGLITLVIQSDNINDVLGDANLQIKGTNAEEAVRHRREGTRTLLGPAFVFSVKSLRGT